MQPPTQLRVPVGVELRYPPRCLGCGGYTQRRGSWIVRRLPSDAPVCMGCHRIRVLSRVLFLGAMLSFFAAAWAGATLFECYVIVGCLWAGSLILRIPALANVRIASRGVDHVVLTVDDPVLAEALANVAPSPYREGGRLEYAPRRRARRAIVYPVLIGSVIALGVVLPWPFAACVAFCVAIWLLNDIARVAGQTSRWSILRRPIFRR